MGAAVWYDGCLISRRRETIAVKLRVGLIGLGDQWQTMHRPALRMLNERFDVRAIYCTVAKLAENAVQEFQADPVDGYQAMVHRDDIDAVLVLEKSWLGYLPAIAASRAGKAIYWAAGLDFDSDRDASFRSSVEESGIAFMASFPKRFGPATLRLKELIATRLGHPRLLFCHKRISSPEQNSSDSVQHQMRSELIELIDWCSYVVDGRIDSVMSANCLPEDPWDYRALSVRFDTSPATSPVKLPASVAQAWESPAVLSIPATPRTPDPLALNPLASPDSSAHPAARSSEEKPNFATAQISCGNYIPAKWQEAIGFRPPAGMQVCCQHGVAFIDLPGTLVWFDDAGRHQESLEGETPVGEKLLGQFHRAVTSLVRNLSGLDDAFQASAVLRAAEQSSSDGRRILFQS